MLFSAGSGCIPQATFPKGNCEVTISNGRDVEKDFADWIRNAVADPTPTKFYVVAFQTAQFGSGGRRLFSVELGAGGKIDAALGAFSAVAADTDVVIASGTNNYASFVLVIRK